MISSMCGIGVPLAKQFGNYHNGAAHITYASIMFNAFSDPLCSKLYWHNRPGPNCRQLPYDNILIIVGFKFPWRGFIIYETLTKFYIATFH